MYFGAFGIHNFRHQRGIFCFLAFWALKFKYAQDIFCRQSKT